MGYDNEYAVHTPSFWLVFDVETVPMPDCVDYLIEPIEAPSNYKDPVKIDAYIAQRREQQIQEAALDLDLCEVVAIGWGLPSQTHVLTRDHLDEREMLEIFWRHVASVRRDFGVLVGFGCLHFDLPVLLRRSLYLDVPAPKLSVDRFRHDGILDVLDVLSYGRREYAHTLGFYCKRFGIPHDETIRGADIARLVAEGDWASVAAHCIDDMQGTRDLALRLALIHAPEPVRGDEVRP